MAMSRLARLASKAPVPVFGIAGANARDRIQDLQLDPRITLVDSPRHARLLLVAGPIERAAEDALRKVHDQVPPPMATLWWDNEPIAGLAREPVTAAATDDLGAIARKIYQDLLAGTHPGEAALCPDEPPAPWEGLGDDGHGGEGMMGGKPYGRPMAMPTDDLRDGLQLDPMDFTVGPFWPYLPPGLCARVSLHGDVIAEFEVLSKPYPVRLPAMFTRALEKPVPVPELELARARYHLRQLSLALRLNGLESFAKRVLQRVPTLKPGDTVADLARHLRRVGFFSSAGAGVGVLNADQLAALGGPTAYVLKDYRDPRETDPVYQQLGFTQVVNSGGDCSGRWRQWLALADQALELAAGAKKRGLTTTADHPVASPRGTLTSERQPEDASHILESLLPGLEWSEAMATINSLDLPVPAAPREPAGGGEQNTAGGSS